MKHSKLVGAVSNCAVSTHHGTYAVRLETAPTGGGESVYLFFEFTIKILASLCLDNFALEFLYQISPYTY